MKNRAGHWHCFVVAAFAFFALIPSALAQFTFTTNNGAITITGYTAVGPTATIPSTLNGYPVTTIGNSAFGGNTSVTSVTIPNSVTNIGSFAFASSGLTGITIPTSVIGIGDEAFVSCKSLTSISVTVGNPAYSSLNGVLFDKPKNTLIRYPPALTISTYTIPATVNTISKYAFYGALNLSAVTFSGNVVNIGDDGFAYCVALSAVYFGGNAPGVGANAFYQTGFGGGVIVYYLPGTTGWPGFFAALGTSLSSSSFWYQPNPAILNFGINGSQFGFTISWATNASIVVEANGNSSDPVWIPIVTNSITAAIGTTNFYDTHWKNFKCRFYRLQVEVASSPFTYSIIDGAITITGYTVAGPSVTIPATLNGYPVTAIGNSAFAGDMTVTSVSIPSSVTNIGASAFASSGLTSISIPASVIGIDQEAFNSCESLTNISVTAGNPAFSSPNGVLFDKALDTLIQYPPGLTISTYTVPATVNTITNYAFYGATNLSTVTFSGDVVNLGSDAFADCVALRAIYFGGNAPNIGANAFYQTGFGGGVTVYYLPGTTGWPGFFTALGPSLSSSSFWYQRNPAILNFGINGSQFGFTISWATNASIVVQANGNPSDPVWVPIATNSVTAAIGTAHFTDPLTSSRKQRYYRLRSP